METIEDMIEEAELDLEDTRENYAWYSPEVTARQARLVILEEVRARMTVEGAL